MGFYWRTEGYIMTGKPNYDDKSKSYYYYNNLTKKTQWEHPLDDIYRGLVKKARTESLSLSLHDNREDMTCITDDILSMDEPPINLPNKKLEPLMLGALVVLTKRKKEHLASTLGVWIKQSLGFLGEAACFLNLTRKKQNEAILSPSINSQEKGDSFQESQQPKSILREKGVVIEHSKSMEFEKLSIFDKSEKDDEDKKSVRFNLDNNTDIGITFSDKSSSEDDLIHSDKNNKADDIINVKVTPTKNRFTVSPVLEPIINKGTSLKLIKPNPTDFIKPKLTLNRSSDSEEDTRSIEKVAIHNMESLFDSDNSDSSHSAKMAEKTRELERKAEKKITLLKQTLWEEKNEEIIRFKTDLETSHKKELEIILVEEKYKQEETIKTELEKLTKEMDCRTSGTLEEERKNFEENMEKSKLELEKLVDIEKELAEKVEKSKEELIFTHNADIEQLKQNHSIIIEEIKREFKIEEQILRKDHQVHMTELRGKMQAESEQEKNKSVCDERMYEKNKMREKTARG
ncbi:hypothetical protein NQ317_007033 [Molorchus minor]|uniref:WW domain-containing protein n=1 Tax=Molorchus minor TaxID=1323400 RepID=A0ABQ9IZZ7_9CUCU|nr:hypothetical protein NQ317_007033 [Molorchus minor]